MILSGTSSPSGKLNGTEMPSSLGDEQGALGCILMAGNYNPDEGVKLFSQLNPIYFTDLRHKEIHRAM